MIETGSLLFQKLASSDNFFLHYTDNFFLHYMTKTYTRSMIELHGSLRSGKLNQFN